MEGSLPRRLQLYYIFGKNAGIPLLVIPKNMPFDPTGRTESVGACEARMVSPV